MITKEEAAEEAEAFLKSHTIGSLATASLDGQPSVSPVYYVSFPDFSIYFSTSHHTEKFKNLLLNPKVSFSVGAGPEYVVVNITGIARVTEEAERKAGLALIEERIPSPLAQWPIKAVKELEEGGLALFKITPTKVTYLNLKAKEQLETATHYYYEILP